MSKITLSQVAEACGVATSTASMALNHSAQVSRLTEDTIRRVRETAARLGYRMLSGTSTSGRKSIGLLTAETYHSMNAFGGTVFRHLIEYGQIVHRDVVLIPLTSNQQDFRERCTDERYSAFILTQTISAELTTTLQATKKPVVAINHSLLGDLTWLRGSIRFDESHLVRTALNHLWSLGHRRIAYVSTASIFALHASANLRQSAYLAWCIEHDTVPLCAIDDNLARSVHALAQRPDRPTALLAYADDVAITCLHLCAELKWAVPTDLSVMGINGQEIGEICSPQLTTISLPVQEMAQRAMHLLESEAPDYHDLILTGVLTPRQSTAVCGR